MKPRAAAWPGSAAIGHTPGPITVPPRRAQCGVSAYTGFSPSIPKLGFQHLDGYAGSNTRVDPHPERDGYCADAAWRLRRDVGSRARFAPIGIATSASLSSLGGEELAHRWQIARQRIRENGVSYNVYGDPLGTDRPWSLDAIPMLIPPEEWSYLEAGLIQRARLLNPILADLYGPQKFCCDGHLPPALVFGNPAFWRACHNVQVPGGNLSASARRRSGSRARWPMVGALRPHPGPFRRRLCAGKPHRPGGDFSRPLSRLPGAPASLVLPRLSRHPVRLSPSPRTHPRVVLLTPGPLNETYFEHSYLARYLGFTLVQGGRSDGAGEPRLPEVPRRPQPVDVILRRVDDGFCDPLELRCDSFLGVAGLVEAVRAGNVAVANALGSGLFETSAFIPFLPGLSRSLLGERLTLPSVATWWCGQPAARHYVRENLDFLVIKPAFPAKGMEPVFGGRLSPDGATHSD